MQAARVVIVGAGLAGLRTAERLRRNGHDGPVVLVGDEPHLPYDRPPLSKDQLAQAEPPSPQLLRAADRYAEVDLDVRTGIRATGLDADARQVRLDDGDAVPYDHLVVATGSAPRTVPGWSEWANVLTLRTFDDCLRLRDVAAAARHATVVGAGVLGSEIAASLHGNGVAVDVVDPLPQPLARVAGERVGAAVADLHRRHGVRLHLGSAVARLDGGRAVERVVLDDGTSWETDLVVLAIGAVPVTGWLESSGIALDDGVLCDAAGATSLPGVWAVGDVARLPHPRGSGTVRLEHWTSAGETAGVVAANIVSSLAGAPLRVHDDLPYVWSDQHGVKIQCLGLPLPTDRLEVLVGDLDETRFVAALTEHGRVRAVVGIGMPGPLARCRTAVAGAMPLAELLELAPWERKKVGA